MENKGPVEISQKADSTKIMVAVLVVGIFLAVILIYEGGKLERYQQQDEKAQIFGQVTQGMTPTPGDTRKNISVSPAMSPYVTMSPSVSPVTSQNNSPSDSPSIVVVSSPSPSSLPTSSPSPSPMVMLKNFQPGSVVINEIGWMGTVASPDDEWIELYNPGTQVVDLTGWSLKSDSDGSPNIIFKDKNIGPDGYFLIERSTDDKAIDLKADLAVSFGNGLKNEPGERLVLIDETGQIIDFVDCSGGKWFSGSNSPKASMERINPANSGNLKENWGTNNGIIKNGFDAKGNAITGTPKTKNSVAVI